MLRFLDGLVAQGHTSCEIRCHATAAALARACPSRILLDGADGERARYLLRKHPEGITPQAQES